MAKSKRKKSIVRASISFPDDHYGELQRIADAKRVSLAWVVREATEQYVANQSDDEAGNKKPV